MRGLLRRYPEGLPTETLVARVRGRRSFLVTAWDGLLLSPDPLADLPQAPWRREPSGGEGWVRRALQREYSWLFRRMNEPLRRVTAPIFLLEELRTINISLRAMAGGHGVDPGLLGESLMEEGVRNILARGGSAEGALAGLAARLATYAPACAELAKIRQRSGWNGVEEALHDIFLERLAATPLHPLVRRFVSLMVDGRNLIAVAKGIRWQQADRPPFATGGSIPLKRLRGLRQRGDLAGAVRLAERLGGGAEEAGGLGVEGALLRSQYRAIRGMGRDPEGVGAIIDYLWRCRNEARVIGLLSRLATAGPEALAGEVVT